MWRWCFPERKFKYNWHFKSFAYDLNTERGTVSLGVDSAPRPAEVHPTFHWFVHHPPYWSLLWGAFTTAAASQPLTHSNSVSRTHSPSPHPPRLSPLWTQYQSMTDAYLFVVHFFVVSLDSSRPELSCYIVLDSTRYVWETNAFGIQT